MQIRIDAMAYGADSVGHVDGKAVFVAGGVPGDLVEAELTSDGKSFSRATVREVLEPSPDRRPSPCPYSAVCGGCPWAELAYEAQLAAKRKNVCDALVRIGRLDPDEVERLVEPVVAPGEPWGYRNKVELAARLDPKQGFLLGMHDRADANQVVRVDRCMLLPKAQQKAVKAVAGALRFMASGRDLGIERVGIRTSTRTGQLEVALWTDPAAFPRNEVAKVVGDAVPATSVARVMTKEKGGARKIAGVETLSGFGSWEEELRGEHMRVTAPSFFQVNTPGAEKLVELVLAGLEPDDADVAVDLYCGAGTFTLPLARTAADVVAVESYGPAVRDLRRNLELAGLDDAAEVVGDDAARQLDCLDDADVVVVDPPRAGLDRSVVEALGDCGARRVAYVSCDPATLARDLAVFAERGALVPVRVTPVDLFPQTFHVETVTVLERR
jgi:23S rRNA (uracil1939-C5)-methyltransferase